MRVRIAGTMVSDGYAAIYRRWGFNEVCCPGDVRKAIEECKEDEDLTLELNSGGGSVWAGFEMYSVIRASGRAVNAEVQSIAGSAASVVMAACNTVKMSPVGVVMIHRASSRAEGNAGAMRESAQMLDTIDESILNAYEGKTKGKKSRAEIKDAMLNETFFTAQKSIEWGLADGMMDGVAEGVTDPQNAVVDHMGVVADAFANALPPIEMLLKKEEEARKNQTAEGENQGEQKELGNMEIKNVQELLAAYPDLCNQIKNDAEDAERKRIKDIEDIALPGFEDLVNAAKADKEKNAQTLAMEMISAQKKSGENLMNFVQQARQDAGACAGVQSTVTEGQKEQEETVADAVKAAVMMFEGGEQ